MRRRRTYEDTIKGDLEFVRVRAETICNPSEDIEKVEIALRNVVEGGVEREEIGEETYLLSVEGREYQGISNIYKGFRDRQVLMAVRRYLRSKIIDRETTTLHLNKQAAYTGVITLGEEEESSLGPIKATISAPDIRKIMDWMTEF